MSKMSHVEPVFNKRLRDSLAATIVIEIPLCFTADDVAVIHVLSGLDLHERSCDIFHEFTCDCEAPARIAALKSIADRIAALLPPTP